jgi:hypothetical protein
MRPVTRAGRWAWGLCGLATAAALAIPGTRLIVSAGDTTPARASSPPERPRTVIAQVETRALTVPQPVTSLDVQGYDGPVQVMAAPVTHVQIGEQIVYVGRPPAVVQSVSGGRLLLADPACASDRCSVSFAVTVPLGVTVTATGGPQLISGVSGANLDSGGAPVIATNIAGPLTVDTGGGPLQIHGLTGPLRAATGGGQLIATRVTSPTAVITTGSAQAQIAFSAAPQSVTVTTRGGLVALSLPGGPYALTTNSDGAPQTIAIATSSAAHRSITITTGGGPLIISSGQIPPATGPPPPDTSGAWSMSGPLFANLRALAARLTMAARLRKK